MEIIVSTYMIVMKFQMTKGFCKFTMQVGVDWFFFLALIVCVCRSICCLHISHFEPCFFLIFWIFSIHHVPLAQPCNIFFWPSLIFFNVAITTYEHVQNTLP